MAPAELASAHPSLGETEFLSLSNGFLFNTVALQCLETDFGNPSSCLATVLISGAFRPYLIDVLILGLMPRGSFVTCEYLRERKKKDCTNGSQPGPVIVVSGLYPGILGLHSLSPLLSPPLMWGCLSP